METTPETRDLDVAALVRDYASKARARYKEVGSPYMHGARDWLASLESMLDRRAIPAPPASAPAAEGREMGQRDFAVVLADVRRVREDHQHRVYTQSAHGREAKDLASLLTEAAYWLESLAPPPPAERAAEPTREQWDAYEDVLAQQTAAPERAQPAAQWAREKAEAIVRQWWSLAPDEELPGALRDLRDAISAAIAERQAVLEQADLALSDAMNVHAADAGPSDSLARSQSRIANRGGLLAYLSEARAAIARLTDGAAAEGKP
jgi:hypothetical protein